MINDPVLNALRFALTALAGAVGLIVWSFVMAAVVDAGLQVWRKIRTPRGRGG
jgi:hypothetical protein